jgi:hypothetical protein
MTKKKTIKWITFECINKINNKYTAIFMQNIDGGKVITFAVIISPMIEYLRGPF